MRIGALALIAALAWPAAATQPGPASRDEGAAPEPPRAPRSAPELYRIGVGDVVEVQVWREPDLSGRYTIDASGALPHMLVGPVPAAGETLETLRARLVERLEEGYLREARVGVSLLESARRKASVLGAVEAPGRYPLREDTRVLDLLFAAGGVSEEAGAHALLKRFGSAKSGGTPGGARAPRVVIRVDLEALLRRGDFRQNLPVAPGDVLLVETRSEEQALAPGRVRVVGEVQRPGSYPLGEAGTALDAVLAAGGLTEYASANRAKLVREGESGRESRRLRLGDVLEGEPEAGNPALRDGDLIVVPESFF